MMLATLKYSGIDWDQGNEEKIKARVALEVIEIFFQQELLIKRDDRHSTLEERYLAMGYPKNVRRCLFVAYTLRLRGTEVFIRPISARYTHAKEEQAYALEVKKLKENA